MRISNITNQAVEYTLRKPLKALSQTKLMDKVAGEYQSKNMKCIAGLGILSIALKDGLGCYLYVKQSLNNKDIPESKRKYVAALDLANGGLMILSQLIMFKTISNKAVQSKIFDKLYGQFFTRAAKKGYNLIIRNNQKFKNATGKDFNIAFDKFNSEIKDAFSLLTTLVAATVLAKRVIVPFIATPMADKAKTFLENQEKKSTASKPKTNKPE